MDAASEQSIDAEEQANVNNGKWTTEEHTIFLKAIEKHGCDWIAIAREVGSRNPSQVRSHAQKYYNKKINDQQRIGYNTEAIIDGNGSTRTRSKAVKVKHHAATPKLSHSRQEAENSALKVPIPKKPIKKEKKSTRPQPVPQTERETCPQPEAARNTFQVMIALPCQGQLPMAIEPITDSETAHLWLENMAQRLKEPSLDLSGMHAINNCGFRGAFKRVNL